MFRNYLRVAMEGEADNLFWQVYAMVAMMTPAQRHSLYHALSLDEGVRQIESQTNASADRPAASEAAGSQRPQTIPACGAPCQRRRCQHQGRALCGFIAGHQEHRHTCSDCNQRYLAERRQP